MTAPLVQDQATGASAAADATRATPAAPESAPGGELLRLYNTLTRKVGVFEPLRPGAAGLYSCGVTVYHYAHIGNLRTYLFVDLLRRVLEAEGYAVRHVENITDVGHLTSDADEGEDKMERGARLQGKTAWEIAAFYAEAFKEDMRRLQILEPTVWCRATDHIPEMIDLIREIEARGFTYRTSRRDLLRHLPRPGLRASGPARPLGAAGRGPHRAQRGEAPPPGLRPVEVLPGRASSARWSGRAPGARASPGGTSSARPCPPSTSASPSTCTPAASTTSRCTTPTRSPRPGRRQASCWPTGGCTGSSWRPATAR